MVVVDEGQRVFGHPLLARHFAALATTIRKWRGSLVLARNTPGALWEAGHGEALWGNALYKVVFAVETGQVDALAQHADVPAGVLDAVRRQLHTRRGVIRDGGRGGCRCGWTCRRGVGDVSDPAVRRSRGGVPGPDAPAGAAHARHGADGLPMLHEVPERRTERSGPPWLPTVVPSAVMPMRVSTVASETLAPSRGSGPGARETKRIAARADFGLGKG